MPARAAPRFEMERRLQRRGYAHPAGLDEVGRGCVAGPVAAGAVILDPKPSARIFGLVRDSKQLRASGLRAARDVIEREAAAFAVGWASAAEIDRVGISGAVRLAMRRAVGKLDPKPDHLLIDAVPLPSSNLPQISIVRGDSESLSIAAASIVAKVERDALMAELAKTYPEYGFDSHKGYATKRHVSAIRRLGPCIEHRMTFRPVSGDGRAPARPSASEVGRRAEEFAGLSLEERGARVVERNFRTRFGEVDLVAVSGDTLVFVEVRARRSTAFGTQAETVSRSKSRRLIAACEEFVQQTDIGWSDWRIDVAAVDLDGWGRPAAVELIESAVEE